MGRALSRRNFGLDDDRRPLCYGKKARREKRRFSFASRHYSFASVSGCSDRRTTRRNLDVILKDFRDRVKAEGGVVGSSKRAGWMGSFLSDHKSRSNRLQGRTNHDYNHGQPEWAIEGGSPRIRSGRAIHAVQTWPTPDRERRAGCHCSYVAIMMSRGGSKRETTTIIVNGGGGLVNTNVVTIFVLGRRPRNRDENGKAREGILSFSRVCDFAFTRFFRHCLD